MNLIKLSVGTASVEDLVSWRAAQAASGQGRRDGLHRHRTRMMPRLADEIVGQGSIFWVIAGAIRCRQAVVGLVAEKDREGRACCDILMSPDIVRTVPQPRRPFQGWRYLDPREAPADLGREGEETPPEGLAEELARLGLI